MSRPTLAVLLFAASALPAAAEEVVQARLSFELEHWFGPGIDPALDPDLYLEVWVDGDRECHRSRVFGALARHTRTPGAPIVVRPEGERARINVQLYESGGRHGAGDRYAASRTLFLKRSGDRWVLATGDDEDAEVLPSGDWVNLRDSSGTSRGRVYVHHEVGSIPRLERAVPGVYRLHLRHRLARAEDVPARLRIDFTGGRGSFATLATRSTGAGGWSPFSTLEFDRQSVLPELEATVELELDGQGFARRKVRLAELVEDETYDLTDRTGTVRGAFQIRFAPAPLAAALPAGRVHRFALAYRLWGAAGALEKTSLALLRGAATAGSSPPVTGLGHGTSVECEVEVECSPFDLVHLAAFDAGTQTEVARRSLFLEELADGEYTLYGEGGESLGLVAVRLAGSSDEHRLVDADAELYWVLLAALSRWEGSNPASYDGLIEPFEKADASGVRDEDLLDYRDTTLQMCRGFEEAGVAPRDSEFWKAAKSATLLWKNPGLAVKSGIEYPKHRKLLDALSRRYAYFPLRLGDRPAVEPLAGGGVRFAIDVHAPTPGDADECDLAVEFDVADASGTRLASGETAVAKKLALDDRSVRAVLEVPGLDAASLAGLRLRVRVEDRNGGRWKQRIYELGER